MTEDCSETGNIFRRNLAFKTTGKGDRGSQTGTAGVGFFFRGPNNIVVDNVSAGNTSTDADTAYGYKYFQQFCASDSNPASTRIPNFPGADTMIDAQVTRTDITIRKFENNEVYGATESGLSYWWVGTYFLSPRPTVPTSTFKGLKVWHVANKGIFAYETSNVVIDGLVIRGANQGFYAADSECGYSGCGPGHRAVHVRGAADDDPELDRARENARHLPRDAVDLWCQGRAAEPAHDPDQERDIRRAAGDRAGLLCAAYADARGARPRSGDAVQRCCGRRLRGLLPRARSGLHRPADDLERHRAAGL